jgi:tRNA A-37 threonylcarbamoyl transferase component Bud32
MGVAARGASLIRRIDRYELLELVGTGGMSAVYRGRDTVLKREVAVKVLHPHLAARAESRARFSREARAVARLSHPSIVEIFDYSGDEAEESWLVTEFVHGRTLRAFVDEVGLGLPEVGVLLCRALAEALAHAHAAGVIHRDLKPENVMVCEEAGRRAVKLADFGIARIVESDERMTMTGALVGSPNHMAPEIVEGRPADARSDVFSLGTLLYWTCTGRMPFEAPNPTATLRRVIQGDFHEPREASPLVGDGLARLIRSTLQHDPALRPGSAAEVQDALDRLLAEDGLERPAEELQAFLSDPEGYKGSLHHRLVAARLARGEALLRAGDATRALAALDGVLALEPDHSTVLAHLARIGRRDRLLRVVRASAGALAIAALVGAILFVAGRREPAPPLATGPGAPGAAASASPGSPSDPAAPATGPSERPGAPGAELGPAVAPSAPGAAPARVAARVVPADGGPAPGRPPPGPPRAAGAAVELAVQVRPYAAQALLDGVEIARGEQRVLFRLGPGMHRMRVEHPCCEPWEREIDAAEASRLQEIKVPLVPLPGRLRVDGDAQTLVWVDGRMLGTAGDSQREPFRVAVPSGAESPYEGDADLRLDVPGQGPAAARVRVRAGQDITVPAIRRGGAP